MAEQQWNDSKLAEVARHDKEKAAIHEAGHVTVAATKGLRAWAWLYRSNTARPLDDKLWRGRAQVAGDNPVYAVAGMVAEQLYWVSDVQAWEIIEEWENMGDTEVGLSPTDMELVPQDWRARTALVEEALAILRDQKPLFDRIVLQLVEHECVTDGMVADWSREERVKPAVKLPRKARRKK
jgi:hypothetical protein